MSRHRAQCISANPTGQNQHQGQDLDTALGRRFPHLQGLLPHLPHEEVQIEKVPGLNYPLGGSNDHFDQHVIIGKISNGKLHCVYAYLMKSTSEVKSSTYDYNDNEIVTPKTDQILKRMVRRWAFEFADNPMKLTGIVLYYFMKLSVVEMVDLQGFPTAIESLATVAKYFKKASKKHLLAPLPVQARVDLFRPRSFRETEIPPGIRLDGLPLSIRVTAVFVQEQRLMVSRFIDAMNEEDELEEEICRVDKKAAELRQQKTSVESKRKCLFDEMSKEDAVELGIRCGEWKWRGLH